MIKFVISSLLFSTIGLLGNICAEEALEVGNNTFTDTLIKTGEGQPTISVTDFNSDGHQDVIIANYLDNNIISFQGNGKGILNEVGRFPVGDRPSGIALSDIDNDGNIDVVIANHETSYVTFLFGDGKGSFKPKSQSTFNLEIKPHPHAVSLSDLNGDNRIDLIVDSRDHNGLLVLDGLANGQFDKPGSIINVGGDPYRGFAVGDINGDGSLDVVTPNQNDIGIMINTSVKKISFGLSQLPQTQSPFAVELAEMNGDGNLDLVVATNGSLISIIPGDGEGQFNEKEKTEIRTAAGAKQIAIGDINGDGIQDALISNWSGEILAVLGSKTAIEVVRFKHPKTPNPWGVALADLNGDGKSDLIIADGNGKLAVTYVSDDK